MSPAQKRTLQEVPLWIYRSMIGGMLTLLLMWFNDFRQEYSTLKLDHQQLKIDFNSHVKEQQGEVNLLKDNIKSLAHNQSILFGWKKERQETE